MTSTFRLSFLALTASIQSNLSRLSTGNQAGDDVVKYTATLVQRAGYQEFSGV